MDGIGGFGKSPFQQFQVGQNTKQNSEANILAQQSDAKRSPAQNLKSETRVDTSAPVRDVPAPSSSAARGGNLDISV